LLLAAAGSLESVLEAAISPSPIPLVPMAGQRFDKQIITHEKAIFHKATLEKLQPIFFNTFALLKKIWIFAALFKTTILTKYCSMFPIIREGMYL